MDLNSHQTHWARDHTTDEVFYNQKSLTKSYWYPPYSFRRIPAKVEFGVIKSICYACTHIHNYSMQSFLTSPQKDRCSPMCMHEKGDIIEPTTYTSNH